MRLFLIVLMISGKSFAQSIALSNVPQKPTCHIELIEFHDAKLPNAFKLINSVTHSKLKVKKQLEHADFALRLRDIDCPELLKIIENQASP